MVVRRITAGLAILVVFHQSLGAAGEKPAELRWSELRDLLVDKRIATVLPDGARIEADVLAVRADALILDIRKSSNPQAYPKGQFSIPRPSVSSLQVIRTGGSRRVLGGVLGAMGGLSLSFLGAHLESTAIAFTGFFVVLPAGIIAGYYLGKHADRRPVEIKVLPEPAAGGETP